MNEAVKPQWLNIARGEAPVVVSVPHAGIEIPPQHAQHLLSLWVARKDTDWWVDRLYGFTVELGATLVRTAVSRTIVDSNRDPSGASLYPGQATTELCPTTTFDGEPLYAAGRAPDEAEIANRRGTYFDPYHAALAGEIARLRRIHPTVVLYDCHSIRSRVPRLFTGELPNFNIGTHSGAACSAVLTSQIESLCNASGLSRVTNGRFKGGYTTRHYGRPDSGVHAIQMELACRSYLREPEGELTPDNWPPDYDELAAAPVRVVLRDILQTCVSFAVAAR